MPTNYHISDGRFAHTLLNWFRANGRQLPWRETTDPYAIWLSEIILQQTRIEQGLPYWQRFMQRWPTVDMLATANEDDVLRQWQGLGYYSRARNLLVAARQIAAGGGFPTTYEGLRKLKGVGDYTAAAVASIAFGQPVAVVDGNVYRVLARHFLISTPINSTDGKHLFRQLAQELLPENEASAYNQALMDFGAMQCVPRSPQCAQCPLADTCGALATGRVAVLPMKNRTLNIRTRQLVYVYVRHQGQTAIHRREAGDIWQGLWEPWLISAEELPAGARLVKKGVRHVLTHRVILADFYLWEPDERPVLPASYQWINEQEIDNYALPRLVERLLETLGNYPSR